MPQTSQDRSSAPHSPCINVCVLGANGHCLGCLRTGDEIARWREMSAQEQWSVIDLLAVRLARLQSAAVLPPDRGSNES